MIDGTPQIIPPATSQEGKSGKLTGGVKLNKAVLNAAGRSHSLLVQEQLSDQDEVDEEYDAAEFAAVFNKFDEDDDPIGDNLKKRMKQSDGSFNALRPSTAADSKIDETVLSFKPVSSRKKKDAKQRLNVTNWFGEFVE